MTYDIQNDRQALYNRMLADLKGLGIGTPQIARTCNVTPSYINIMKRRQRPSMRILKQVSELLSVAMLGLEAHKRQELAKLVEDRQRLQETMQRLSITD